MSIRNGTRRCWTTGTIAAASPELNGPWSICAPALIRRSASARATSPLVCVSPSSSSSFIPPSALMPPAALIASAAIWAPTRRAGPGSASGPVTGWMTPILKVFACARSGSGNPTTAAPAAAVLSSVRRVTRVLAMTQPPLCTRINSVPCVFPVALSVGRVSGNDLRLDRKQLGLRRIDGDPHPVRVGIAEHLDAGEVLVEAPGLLADERLVHAEGVRVAGHEQHGLGERLHLGHQRIDQRVIGCALGILRYSTASTPHVAALAAPGPMGLEGDVRLGEEHEPTHLRCSRRGERLLHPREIRRLAPGVLGVHLGRPAEIVVAAYGVQGRGHHPVRSPG